MAETKQPKRYFVWIILILIFVGLLGFGTGGLSGNVRTIGSVGDKDLSVAAYQRNLRNQLQALSQQFGTQISFQQAQAFGIDQAALSQLVLARTLDNEASQIGISVSDELVREQILLIPEFQGGRGQFNRDSYRYALQNAGQTEAEFETGLREDMTRSLLQSSVVGGIPAADAYADTLVQYIGERRSITWAAVDAGMLNAPIPGATEADLQEFYDANPDDFTLPEAREFTYVWLTPDMIQDDVEVDETSLRELYDDRSAEFIRPERRLVERLIFADLEKANAAKARIETDEVDFEGLVAERGLDLSDIDLGDVSKEDLREAGDAVFAADLGAVVGPVETSFGPALFRMNAVLAASEITFEDARGDLREELAAERARRVIDQSLDQVNDLMAGGATLEDLDERTDLSLGTIKWSVGTEDGIAAYEGFRSAAAAAQEGAFPEILELADGGVFALRLDAVTPPEVQPLDEVRDAVREAWGEKASHDAIVAKAEEITAQIEPLTGFDTLSLTATNDADLTRRSFVEGTPPGFIGEVFEMSVGEVRVVDSVDNALIVRLEDISAPDEDDPQTIAERESLASNAASGIAQDVFEAYATAVQQRTDVVINQATINAINAHIQ